MTTEPDLSPAGDAKASEEFRQPWETVRQAFKSSIMVNTGLNSLAQNLDIADWPLPGADETPAKYIDLDFDKLNAAPGLAGHPKRVEQLITLLADTLAFDEPFGDMITETELQPEKDNPILKNLAKLGIPEHFPLSLVALLPETRDYCNLENLITLRDFALFAQNLSQTVVVSGDFRSFLNALSHIDEKTLAIYLPFRPGAKGLHLLEGVALTVRAQTNEVQAALAQKFGARLGTDDLAAAGRASNLETTAIEQVLPQQAAAYVEYFQGELAELQSQINEGVPLSRLASVLKEPLVESIVTGLLKPYLTLVPISAPTRTSAPPLDEEFSEKKGFWASLTSFFRK